MVAKGCQMIPRRKRSDPSPSSGQSLIGNMKRQKTSHENTKVIVSNLDHHHQSTLLEFPGFLSQKVSELHNGACVQILNCQRWNPYSVLVEFPNSKQRDLALSMNGEVFYKRALRVEPYDVTRQRGGGRGQVQKKQCLCHYFSRGYCKFNDRCWNAHGVLDLKLYHDTQLQEDQCWYINQIDSGYSSSNLFNLIEFKFKKHQGSGTVLTALHHRQQMGDALIQFASPALASKAKELLHGVRFGSQTIAIHPLASGYQDIFVKYFDNGDPIEIKLDRVSPPAVAALPRHISPASSEETGISDASNHVDPGRTSDDSLATVCAISDHGLGQQDCAQAYRQGDHQESSSSTTMASTAITNEASFVVDQRKKQGRIEVMESLKEAVRSHCVADNTREVASESTDLQEGDTLDATVSDCPDASKEVCRSKIQNDSSTADSWEEPMDSSNFQHEDVVNSATSDSSESFPPLPQPVTNDQTEEDKKPQEVVLQHAANRQVMTALTRDHEMESKETESVESGECTQEEEITGMKEEELQEKESIESEKQNHSVKRLEVSEDKTAFVQNHDDEESKETQSVDSNDSCPWQGRVKKEEQDENQSVMSEASKESFQCGFCHPLPRALHPIIADDEDMDRMRDEIFKLRMEQWEKTQLLEHLRKENEQLKHEDGDDVEMKRMRNEIAELKSELLDSDHMLEDIKKEHKDLKQETIKIEHQRNHWETIAQCYLEKLVARQISERKMIKVEEDNERLRQENHDLRQCKEEEIKQLKVEAYDRMKDNSAIARRLEEQEAENEQLQEELEQMRMCRAMEQGFAGE